MKVCNCSRSCVVETAARARAARSEQASKANATTRAVIRNKFRALDPAFGEIENYTGFGYCWRKPS